MEISCFGTKAWASCAGRFGVMRKTASQRNENRDIRNIWQTSSVFHQPKSAWSKTCHHCLHMLFGTGCVVSATYCLTRLHWKFFWCLTNLGSIKLNGWHQLQLTGKSGWTALRSDVIGSHWCPSVRETDTGHNWDTGLGTNWKSDPRRTTTLQDASNVHGSDTLKTQTSFWVFEHIGSYRHIWASSRSSRIGFFQVAEGDHIDTLRAAAKSLGNVQFCWHCRASSAPKIITPEQTPKTTNLAT